MTPKKSVAHFCCWLATCWLAIGAVNVKTVNGVARANVKTVNGVALANVKTVNGVDNTAGGGSTVAEDNVGTAVSGTTVGILATVTVTVGAGSNRLLIVSCGVGDSSAGDRVVDSVVSNQGGTFVRHDGIDEGVWTNSEIWYLIAPATATHTITVTWSVGTVDQICAQATSYTGVNQTTPMGAASKASGNTGTSCSTGSITYATGGLIYGMVSTDSEGTLSTAAGTERWKVLNVATDTAYSGATRTSTGAITFTQANNERYAVIGALIQAAP